MLQNTLLYFILNTLPYVILNTLLYMILNSQLTFILNTIPCMILKTLPYFILNALPYIIPHTLPYIWTAYWMSVVTPLMCGDSIDRSNHSVRQVTWMMFSSGWWSHGCRFPWLSMASPAADEEPGGNGKIRQGNSRHSDLERRVEELEKVRHGPGAESSPLSLCVHMLLSVTLRGYQSWAKPDVFIIHWVYLLVMHLCFVLVFLVFYLGSVIPMADGRSAGRPELFLLLPTQVQFPACLSSPMIHKCSWSLATDLLCMKQNKLSLGTWGS